MGNTNNKMKKKGFTLFETLISTIVFGIIMILMFQMSSAFFNLFTKSSSKQSINSKFIKAYTQMQKDFSISDAKSMYSYKNYKISKEENLLDVGARWIALPIPTDNEGTIQGSGNSFEWSRICIYYLSCSKNCKECQNKKNVKILKWEKENQDKYRYCSDKELTRLVYDYKGSSNPYIFARVLSAICKDISKYTLNNKNAKELPSYNSEKKYTIDTFNKGDENSGQVVTIKLLDHKIIATDIFDMEITQKSNNIKINLSSIRKEEIKKILKYGYEATDFTEKDAKGKEKYSEYIDKIEFLINTNNS